MFELRQYNLRHGPLCYNCVNTTYVTAYYVRIASIQPTSWPIMLALRIWLAGHFVTHYMVLGTLRDLLYGSGTLRDLLYGSGTLRDSLYGSRDTS